MPDKKCPNCGLWNTENAMICDCGYDFGMGRLLIQEGHAEQEKPDLFKNPDFWKGFGLWWALNIAGFAINPLLGLVLTPTNVIVLLFLAFIKRWRITSFGYLAAYALNLTLSLLLGLVLNATCGIPFFLGEPNIF